ncbi:competence protein ComEA helix-hairpin-helix repeat region [Raoultella planticola]|nr:competence protein ComEA helix-hairpin-helix repeat region [Raoultella planticola]
MKKHNVELVAIGNGTASRETERFFLDVQQQFPKVTAQKVIVSEAGASVYSASELAALEFPDLDVSLRGAVSIARRLQDPLAELVKIDPKSIGVGQYQHDVSQSQLARKLDAVVEDCVNAVGVDLNTASVPLLTRVAGLTRMMAQNIVAWRDENGQFQNRQQLLKVSRLGSQSLRAVRRVPAHQPRRQPAGRLHRSPGSIPYRRAHSGRHPAGVKRSDGQQQRVTQSESGRLHR